MSKEALIKVKDNTGIEKEVFTDSNGNLPVNLGTALAGEDITNDVLKVEQRFTPLEISTAIGTLVKTGVGVIKSITFNNVGTAWEVDVYDGTASTGTSIGKIRGAGVTTLTYDGAFSVGLFVDTVKGTTPGNITVSYR
jgi:hypothetical protein